MTVSSQTNKVVISGNGVTTVFSYNFQVNTAADLQVIYTDSTGVSTTISSAQYSISGLGNPSGGTITYPLVGSPIAANTTLTITRQLALTQPTSMQNQGSFYPAVVEAMVDRICMEIQQVNEMNSRMVVAPITDPATMLPLPSAVQRANKAFLFDAFGNPIAGSLTTASVVSSAMQPVTSAATLALARTAFGLGALALENIGKGLQDDGAGSARVNFSTEAKAINYAVLPTDHGERYIVTGPVTFTFPQTTTLWNGFEMMVDVYGGALILTPNAADSFENNASGASSYVPAGSKAYICTNGAGTWYVRRVRSYQSAVTPGGYLTLNASGPVLAVDAVSATTVYYNADVHGFIPIYNGSEWIEFPFLSLSCALNATQQLASTAHDAFVTLVGGIPTLIIGPAWRQAGFGLGKSGFTSLTNATPMVCTASGHNLSNGDDVWFTGVMNSNLPIALGAANGGWTVSGVAGAAFTLTGSAGNGTYSALSGTFASRGVGAGTSQLAKTGGLYTNAVQIVGYNGATPYTVAPGMATYVGSVLIDTVAGQVSCHRTYGQSRKWGVWNAYNRKQITLKSGDSTTSWTNATVTPRYSNNNAANSCIAFVGLPEEPISGSFNQQASSATAGGGNFSVGYASGTGTLYSPGTTANTITTVLTSCRAQCDVPPTIGMVTISSMESSSGTTTHYGSENNSVLTVSYKG